MKKIVAEIKSNWQSLVIGGVTPLAVAVGFSLGTFVALLPSFGFSFLLAILMMYLFPKINRPAVLLSLAIWNPLAQIPIYALSFEIGSYILHNAPVVNYEFELLNQVYRYTRRFFIGHLFIMLVVTLISFVVAWFAARWFLEPPEGIKPETERS